MIQKFKLKDIEYLEMLHDSSTSSIELDHNKLIMCFDHVCAATEEEEITKSHRKLKATYILSQSFNFRNGSDCCVRQINEKEIYVKDAIIQFSLIKFIDFLKNNQRNLVIYSQYYNKGKCIINSELIEKNVTQYGNWFEIELLVDEIIYEWIE